MFSFFYCHNGKWQLARWEKLGRFETSSIHEKKNLYDYESYWKKREAEEARRENLVGFERRKDLRRRNFGIRQQGSRHGWSGGGPIDTVRYRRRNGTPPLRRKIHEELGNVTLYNGNELEFLGIVSKIPKRATRLIGERKHGWRYDGILGKELAILRERQSRPRLKNEPAPMNYWDRQSRYIGPKLAYASLAGNERALVLA